MDKSMKPYFAIMADLSQIGLFSSALSPQKDGDPHLLSSFWNKKLIP